MIQRINFFYKKQRGFSYRLLFEISLGVFLILFSFKILEEARLKKNQAVFGAIESELYAKNPPTKKIDTERDLIEKVGIELAADPSWAQVLKSLSSSAPQGLWFEEIRGEIAFSTLKTTPTQGAFRASLNLQANAETGGLIPKFVSTLQHQSHFSKVELVSTESVSNNTEGGVKFDLEAELTQDR